jgi:uncharacterized protein YndB with AHSA1/START domain
MWDGLPGCLNPQMIEFTLRRTTTAPIEKVFDALTNHRGIADYVSMARRSTLDREGVPAPNGVGAVRRIEALGPAIVEEIIEYERPTRYAYKMVSGAPVRDHVGTVTLREAGSGTEAEWHLRSTPKIPGLDWLLTPVLKKVIGDLFKGAITAAERNS